MFATMILTVAMMGQSAPRNEIADLVASPERQRQLLAQMQARKDAPAARAPMRRQAARYSSGSSSRMAGYRAHNREVQREVMAREMQAAAIMAEQARQYRADLPYMLEMRGQDLNRQSNAERNAILNRYLNGNSGIYVPPITVVPQPANNGNMLPTP